MSSAPWTSTILQKPQTPLIFSLLPSPSLPLSSSRNIQFPKLNDNLTVKPLNSSPQPLYGSVSPAQPQAGDDDDEEPAIGDCLVYEEGIFNDPFIENNSNSTHSDARTTKSNNNKDADVLPENLIPEEWMGVQKELNITKKERRKMAQELEYGSRVEKRRQALMPLNSEEFEKIKQEKLKQLSPVVLDNPKKVYFRENGEKLKQPSPVGVDDPKNAHVWENGENEKRDAETSGEVSGLDNPKKVYFRENGEKLNQLNPVVLDNPRKAYFRENEKHVEETRGEVSGGRVAPRNPRLAVYGGGLDDVSALFSSGKYDSGAAGKSQGTRKLFSLEEKSMMNRRVPDVAVATSGKWHPLHTLAAAGEFFLVTSLLKHNLDINIPDKNGLTAIHKAILAKKQAIFNFLLRESANPFVRDNEGATLLHYAVFAASSQMIKILLLYNVDINLQDNDGWTPLHLAVQSRRTDILRLLLIKGADKSLKNRDGFTAVDLCLYSGRDTRTYELIKLLKRIY
ncbi:ankyrin repeat protein [Perilla frutescens var. hirtella]|uniref:Ankyrin repeat protein n=1 Tax=Perilla frutescens var. hirtella TaxID=608512 RepID=A0AAD4ISM2_PERFH|nr:ankyrin repeat protein [Perilla frutescens var. hirtella]